MQSKSGAREQSAGHSRQAMWRAVGIALLSSLSLFAVVGLISHPTTAAGLDSISNMASGALAPSANTSSLPSESRPAGVSRVSDNHPVYLPIVARNYPLLPPPIAIQAYGNLDASTGLTWVVASGVGWIRIPINWLNIEPVKTTPRTYNWATADASILAGADAGLNFIATIANNPSWAAAHSGGPVNDPQDLRDFVSAVVARYPQVAYWEIYNEPDRIDMRFGENGAGYAAMLQSVYPVIKAANPNAQVVMGGLSMDFFKGKGDDKGDGGFFDRQFLTDTVAACAATPSLPCFDMANFHYYPTYRARWEPYGRDISGKAAFIRQTLATYNYVRPVLNTETGWWPASIPTDTFPTGQELAARYIPKTFARAIASNLLVANLYSLFDGDDVGLPGVVDKSGAPRPSFAALKTWTTLLGQAKYVRAIPSSETGDAQIEAYQFSVPSATGGFKRLEVYWYDCSSLVTLFPAVPADCANTAPLQISAPQIGMIDKLGGKTILSDAADGLTDGKVTILIGASPIYIDYQP
jgi:hypothetical protein